jgi:hypothetical protein
MAREFRAKGASKSARALGHLERMTGFSQQSEKVSRTIGKTPEVGRRLQIPAQVSLPRHVLGFDGASRAGEKIGVDPLQNRSDETRRASDPARLSQKFAAGDNALKASARATDRIKSDRMAQGLARAMDALARIGRSIEPGTAAGAILAANQRAIPMAGSSLSGLRSDPAMSARARENSGENRGGSSRRGLMAGDRVASSMREMVAPPNVSQREFAQPSGGDRGASNNNPRAGVTINSSPTVVINAPATGGNVQRDVIGALRAHREELFDQLRRESARRERAQF